MQVRGDARLRRVGRVLPQHGARSMLGPTRAPVKALCAAVRTQGPGATPDAVWAEVLSQKWVVVNARMLQRAVLLHQRAL